MSESVAEGLAGDTGVVETSGDGSSAPEGHAEDQQAEEQLHEVMQAQDPDELKKELDRWRSLAQRHEKTARTNAEAAKQWREQQDANKTELQRAQEAAAAAEERANAVTAENARMLAAAANNLSPDLIEFLGDGTAEEIGERGAMLSRIIEEEVVKRVGDRSKQTPGNGRPTPRGQAPVGSMRSGSSPSTGGNLMGPEQLFRDLLNGQDS